MQLEINLIKFEESKLYQTFTAGRTEILVRISGSFEDMYKILGEIHKTILNFAVNEGEEE